MMRSARALTRGLAARPWLVLALATVALVGGLLVTRLEPPAAVEDLEGAQRAGEVAGAHGEDIVANLEGIAANISAGSTLPERSDTIHNLTARQRRSLLRLAEALEEQLNTLRSSHSALVSAERSARGIERTGAEQAALIRKTVALLRRLRASAGIARATSLRFAQQAVYGARLAEDSERRFRQ